MASSTIDALLYLQPTQQLKQILPTASTCISNLLLACFNVCLQAMARVG
jgi:hypothetical protein